MVHKLRTIHLLKAYFQMGTKSLLGKQLIKHALDNKQVPKEQYATKGKRGIDAVLVKRLFFNLLQILHIAGSLIANDARGCFDRMALPVSSLCLRRMGAAKSILQTLYAKISSMKHFIRTRHGESESFYTNLDGEHLQGGGQGNGAGPPTWLCISIILINIINSFGVNSMFCTAISGISIVL